MVYSKKSQRLSLREKLGQLSLGTVEEKSRKLSSNLVRFFKSSRLGLVIHDIDFWLGAFAPMQLEPIWHLEWPDEWDNLAFPARAGDRVMAFFASNFCSLRESGEFGAAVMVPPKDGEPVIPKALLVPGLAFSRDGNRLGRGAGFYDRYLAGFAGMKIGLCFEEQVLSNVVTENHDIAVDCVITDENIFYCTSDIV